ncbi:NrfD/PsrC family molybdoenzyme membrane anchor subunit [Sulfurisoma sediminicola]|uniref:Molybdopterin-containing oxidoreductase family membrane subunit n=1 Tax=Sulfurisoma sediminicola TaxID=1381557 RepID=A0A497XAW9_9PROT|nr:NrfD/PsrC family molybdoenzyme membrane anchor subunit [Sulfurisoma sediminicola]RLJ63460.1 molybdopterin-containing oxidoreductase family membrane subunit [Sulfurisoma sediminicola]
MKIEQYTPAEERLFYILLALGGLVSALGLAAAYYMEHSGHVVTGMTNQVFWGLPHVFGIFLIVAASGVLNVASIGSVFGKKAYKPRAPLSGLLAIIMLAAGLAIIMLDLGRADRVLIAATHVNLTSVFGWNMILYPVFFGLVGLYLWTLMDRRMNAYYKAAGFSAFIWRLVMTTGTGSIFGFVVARQAYQSAILAPMFIIMSFAWGLAVFLLVQRSMYAWNNMELNPALRQRLKNLLGTFITAVLYFVIVYHLTNIYYAKETAFEHFILVSGGVYPLLFWGGYVVVGTLLPLFLLYHPAIWQKSGAVSFAAALTIIGGLCQLYVFIIGGQAFPLEMFPGMEVTSTFFDGAIGTYVPSVPEILLSLSGIGIGFTLTVIGVRVLRFLPQDDVAMLKDAGYLHD